MKIGILTYHKSINYGSVLQVWSMYNKLIKEGYEVEVIDYEPKQYCEMYGNKEKKIVKKIIFHIIYKALKKQTYLFEEFRNNYLSLSKEKYYYDSDFDSIGKEYDVVICGSDQIWNVYAKDCDPIYFLPFSVKGKKIAYAPSVNIMTFKEERYGKELKKWMLDFDYISCREKTGATKIFNYLDRQKEVETVLDPTFFNESKDLLKMSSERLIKGDYIFLYYADFYGHTDYLMETIKEIKKATNMPVYTILMTKSVRQIMELKRNGIRIKMSKSSPNDFLSFIRHAKFVVTNSFHGTAISLIMKKQFVAINDIYDDGTHKDDERIKNILSEFNLLDRMIKKSDLNSFDLCTEIDYEKIDCIRRDKARKSFEWLKNAIEE